MPDPTVVHLTVDLPTLDSSWPGTACRGRMANWSGSRDPEDVTCRSCQRTTAYRNAAKEHADA